jgi:uncharacterized protein YbgA (DUF1722 family)/uncharacterized protein YbbK (DUF523 family)
MIGALDKNARKDHRIRLGVSACLLGERVRYDGGHKLDPFLRATLGRYVEFVPVCPEVECGLGTPREQMRLVGDPASPRLVTLATGADRTNRMLAWVEGRLEELAGEDLWGFIFKSGSPSSGMARVKVYSEDGTVTGSASGLFAGAFLRRFPELPAEDEERLQDPVLRENFIQRVFAWKRWRDALSLGKTLGGLVAFHTSMKLLLLAHSPVHYREMGRLVAGAASLEKGEPGASHRRYRELFDAALRREATPRKHANVLQHAVGYLRRHLSAVEKEELLSAIERHRLGELPLLVPLTLLKHCVRTYGEPYLLGQAYLNRHPLELQLTNHA